MKVKSILVYCPLSADLRKIKISNKTYFTVRTRSGGAPHTSLSNVITAAKTLPTIVPSPTKFSYMLQMLLLFLPLTTLTMRNFLRSFSCLMCDISNVPERVTKNKAQEHFCVRKLCFLEIEIELW